MPELEIKNTRKQSRKRSGANVSMSWVTYDRLDKLAQERNTSIGKVITALVDFYEDNK